MAKQVIVWRHDLNVRKGKIAAQVAHASLAAVLHEGGIYKDEGEQYGTYIIPLSKDMHEWLTGRFTKICVYCQDEAELLALYVKAQDAELPCALITDAGLTEFNGVRTNTCIAIGPADEAAIDEITGHLPLL